MKSEQPTMSPGEQEEREKEARELLGEAVFHPPASSEIFKNKSGKKFERLRYEYRDGRGNLICEAIVEKECRDVSITGLKTAKGGEGATGRDLKRFELIGKDANGKPLVLDVLEMCNPHNARIIVGNELLSNYHYVDRFKTVIVPSLDSPLNVGILLHELGHADQYRDEKFKETTPLYRSRKIGEGEVLAESFQDEIDKVFKAAPEAAGIMSKAEAEKALPLLDVLTEDVRNMKATLEEKENEILALENDTNAAAKDFIVSHLNIISWIQLKFDLAAAENDVQMAKVKKEDAPQIEKDKTAELLSKLEAAGFRFAASAAPMEEGGPISRLSFQEINDLDDLDDIFVAINSLDADYCKMKFREPDKLTINLPVKIKGERRNIVLELNVSADDYLGYEEKLEKHKGFIGLRKQEKAAHKRAFEIANEKLEKELAASGVKDILALPSRKMERDATYRALRWLKKIRDKSRINLFRRELRTEEGEEAVGLSDLSCENSVRQGFHLLRQGKDMLTILKDLKAALWTYGAERPPLAQKKKKT